MTLLRNYKQEAINQIAASLQASNPVLLMVAGGSVTEQLIAKLPTGLLGLNVTLTVTDERFTKKESDHNFTQLLLLPNIQTGISAGMQVIDTRLSGNDKEPEDLAQRFETQIRLWISAHENGKIIMVAGMGADGHTLGVFPDSDENRFNERFLNPEAWVIGYDAGSVLPTGKRVTTTLSFINKADKVLLFFEGLNKQNAFAHLKTRSLKVNSVPAAFLYCHPRVSIYTDLV